MGFLLLGLLPPPTDDRRPTDDRPTDRPTDRPRSELLLAPPLSFFYTHTRHTHVDSLTHTRQTHTRSLTVPFAHGARAGASLDTHTHSRRTHVRSRCPSAFHTRHTLGSLAARFCWQGQHFRLWTVPERVSGPPRLMLPGAALGSLAARFCWQGQHFRLWTVPERVSGPPPLMLPGAALGSLHVRSLDSRCPSAFHTRHTLGSLAARFCWQGQHFRLWTVPERVSGPPPLDAARRSTWEPRGSFLLAGSTLGASRLVSAGREALDGA